MGFARAAGTSSSFPPEKPSIGPSPIVVSCCTGSCAPRALRSPEPSLPDARIPLRIGIETGGRPADACIQISDAWLPPARRAALAGRMDDRLDGLRPLRREDGAAGLLGR